MKKLSLVVAIMFLMIAGQVKADTMVLDHGVAFPECPRLPQMADEDIDRPQPVNTGFSDMHYAVAYSSGIVGVALVAGSFLAGKNYSQPLAFIGGGLLGTSACLGFGF
jgi:hypothetical protein